MCNQWTIERATLDLMRLFIVTVSALDVFLTIKFDNGIQELNPLGRWLMFIDSGDVALFMALKLLGTCTACWLMGVVYFHSKRVGLAVTFGAAVFQLWLFWFLVGR